MGGGHTFRLRVPQEDRDAVGRDDPQDLARFGTYEVVRLLGADLVRGEAVAAHAPSAVDLVDRVEVFRVEALAVAE